MPPINPYEIICDEIMKFIKNHPGKTVDGDDVFSFTIDKFGLERKITMSLIGGLMARKIIWSPRPGVFQLLTPDPNLAPESSR